MESAGRMQNQLRRNNDELVDYLKGLENWEEEMKEKDQQLSKHKSILKENFPPVRSSGESIRKKTKRKKKESTKPAPASRIHSYDYRAWDKFDVQKACEDVDYEVETSSESEEDGEEEEEEEEEEETEEGGRRGSAKASSSEEEEEMERHRAMAATEKEKGNALYKEGDYEGAVECYSRGILLDPVSAALSANRAMALLKLERYAAVEEDCNTAITLDENYVKAYLRRGVARRHLGKLSDAVQDFELVLRLEPKNKQAVAEMKTTKQLKEEEERKRLVAEGHVFPVKRPPHLRSKKPLKKIQISEITPTEEGMTVATSQVENISTEPASASEKTTETARQTEGTTKLAGPSEEISTVASNGSSKDTSEATTLIGPTEEPMECDTNNTRPSIDVIHVAPMTMDTVAGGNGNSRSSETSDSPPPPPPIPETSYQFQADWKSLRHNQFLLTAYYKQIPPVKYPVLLQQSLETTVFSDIITIIGDNPDYNWLEGLNWLTKVQRFSVAVMFLSSTDKHYLEKIFEKILIFCNRNEEEDSLKTLASKFGVKLKL